MSKEENGFITRGLFIILGWNQVKGKIKQKSTSGKLLGLLDYFCSRCAQKCDILVLKKKARPYRTPPVSVSVFSVFLGGAPVYNFAIIQNKIRPYSRVIA